ncbi:MAG TPA: hypothetical protein VKH37_02320, partial [Ferruginibacter sp.]|nr:hypothetical protein [Ferruginibacter sp.]
MKCKSILIWTCLLLAINGTLTGQMKRIVVNKANIVVNRNQGSSSSNNPSSCVVDTITLTSQAQIDNFSTNYPACTTPKYLFIDGTGATPAITNLTGLSTLNEIKNKLRITHTSLTNLSPLNNLVLIGDTLDVEHNPLLTQLGLVNLDSVGALILIDLPVFNSLNGFSNNFSNIGSINIDSTALTNLNGLSGIINITQGGFYGLRIAHTPVTNLNGLANLSSINGYMILESNPDITSLGFNSLTSSAGFLFNDMPNLISIAGLSNHLTNTGVGTFWMINTGLTNLVGMDSLTSASNFYIWSNPNLTSLHGLERLSGNVGGGISIYDNQLLNNVSALSNITSIDGSTLEIHANPALTNLVGVGNITTIGHGLWINDNDGLTSLADLNSNLDIQNNGNEDSVRINDNAQLALCSFGPLCNYLTIDGRAEISNNATGCSTISEMLASCTAACAAGTERTWNGNNSSDWDDANNWTPSGVPGTC